MKSVEDLNQARVKSIELEAKAQHEWLTRLVTLSTGALTLLVSLQNTYVPRNPQAIWLLSAAWVLLAVSVLTGLLALYGEVRVHREYRERISREVQRLINQEGPETIGIVFQKLSAIPWTKRPIFEQAMNASAGSLAFALVALVAFAVSNLP